MHNTSSAIIVAALALACILVAPVAHGQYSGDPLDYAPSSSVNDDDTYGYSGSTIEQHNTPAPPNAEASSTVPTNDDNNLLTTIDDDDNNNDNNGYGVSLPEQKQPQPADDQTKIESADTSAPAAVAPTAVDDENQTDNFSDETPHPFDAVPTVHGPDEPDYSVRALNVSAAIFEHVAPVHFYTQRWKILANVQLPDFSESLDAIDRYDDLVRQVCDGFSSVDLSMARPMIRPLKGQTNKANSSSTTTTSTTTTTSSTTESAALNQDEVAADTTTETTETTAAEADAETVEQRTNQMAIEQARADLQAHCRNAEREVTLLIDRVRTTNEELRKVTTPTRRKRVRNNSAEPTKAKVKTQTRKQRMRRDVTEETVTTTTTTSTPKSQSHRAGRHYTVRTQPLSTNATSASSRLNAARQLYLAVEEVVEDKLYDRVELLEREAQWGFQLMKNELGVLRGTNNAVYKTIWKMTDVQKENDANIKRMVKKLRSFRGAVGRESDALQARLTLVELVQLIALELTGMVEQQNEVLSLVTTSAAGRLHPMVMGVGDLSRVYTNMSNSLGLSDILVGGEEMPKMVRIQAAQDGRNVDVLIEVPMVKRDEYQLYRAYALPQRIETRSRRKGGAPVVSASAVVLEDEYLAVNERDQTYVVLSEAELRACNMLGAHFDDEQVRFVCKLTGPLYTGGHDSCVISLFQQRPLLETPCEMRAVPKRETSVVKMRMASTWLWLATNATTVRLSCSTRRSADEVLVPSQSIVQLNGMCELETHSFRLQAENTIFRNATVLQSKQMSSGSNIAAIDEFAQQQVQQPPAFASHDIDQDPIRLTQPRQYHRWLNQNGRAISALARSFRQVEAARKKEKQTIANQPAPPNDYVQVMLTMGQVAVRFVRLIISLVTRFMGGDDDDFFDF